MLTLEQSEVINSIAPHRCIIAGAGTGKTTTLIQALNTIDSAIAFSFTNNAAHEIKERLEIYKSNITSSTIHSFCWDVIKELSPNTVIIKDDSGQKNIIKSILPSVKREEIKDFQKQINLLKAKGLRAVDTDNHTYESYENQCNQYGYIDFAEMAMLAYDLLSQHPEERKYDYIFVDEFQDTDAAQYRLIKLLIDRSVKGSFVVGDPRQAIYGWRGAESNIFDQHQKNYSTAVFELTTNFRSTAAIVNLANQVTIHKKLKPLVPFFTGPCQVIKISKYGDERLETKITFSNIRELVNKGELENIAVLFRKNSDIRKFEYQFYGSCITPNVWGGFKFTDYREIKAALAWLRIIDNPEDQESFVKAALTVKGMGEKGANGITIYDCVTSANKGRKGAVMKEIGMLYQTVANIDNVANVVNVLTEVLNLAHGDSINAIDTERLSRLKTLGGLGHGKTISEFVEMMAMQSTDQKQSKGKVILSTIHKAKGLEFDVVFIPFAEKEGYPLPGGDYTEENNIFYVATTRAKKKLFISYSNEATDFIDGMNV